MGQVVALERPELVAQEFATSMELLGGLRKVRKETVVVVECNALLWRSTNFVFVFQLTKPTYVPFI